MNNMSSGSDEGPCLHGLLPKSLSALSKTFFGKSKDCSGRMRAVVAHNRLRRGTSCENSPSGLEQFKVLAK